jgi:hypothetical protein
MRKTTTATKTKRSARTKAGLPSAPRKNSHAKSPGRITHGSATKTLKASNSFSSDLDSSSELLRSVPLSTEDRLEHIHALGQRVGAYIKFMCTIGRMEGSSAESKDRAVAVFYDRLFTLEQELARIHDNVLLG